MRSPWTITLVLFASGLSAQLTNGSFETGSVPDLTGWYWTCDAPETHNDAAPGGGIWCASKLPGHAKGCWPSYLYQPLAGVEVGDLVTLTAWVKCPEVVCQGGFLGLGRTNNGNFELEETASAVSTEWTFVSITDTVESGPGDTAIVVLNSGSTGGPASFSGTYFDDVEVEISTHMEDHNGPRSPLVRVSPDGGRIAVRALPNERIRLFDASGRVILQDIGSASGWRELSVPAEVPWVLVHVQGAQARSQRVVLAH